MDKTSIFKFATIRNATDEVATLPDYTVNPESQLVSELADINNGSLPSSDKLSEFNAALEGFVNGSNFIKSKSELADAMSQTGTQALYKKLYDNIIARTITRSNKTGLFRQLIKAIKAEHILQHIADHPEMTADQLRVIMPESLLFTFLSSSPSTSGTNSSSNEARNVIEEHREWLQLQELVEQAKTDEVLAIKGWGSIEVINGDHATVAESFDTRSIPVQTARQQVTDELDRLGRLDLNEPVNRVAFDQMKRLDRVVTEAMEDRVSTFEITKVVSSSELNPVLDALQKQSLSIPEAERLISAKLVQSSNQLYQLAPGETFAHMGGNWVPVGDLVQGLTESAEIQEDGILIYNNDCSFKFPFKVADLRVVEQQTVGYLPGEIAHINNTQPGEENTRVTRRLKRSESYESLITEDETFRETDTSSTEKFGFEKEASQVQKEESGWNVNASVSASYGPVSASVDGGYESSSSSTNSNSSSMNYAKELVEKTVDRVISKVKSERSTKTIEEFEETVTHVIDNKLGDGPKSYVYRWMNKLSRATLKNYGKRLIFEIDIAHPSHYHLSRSITEQPTVTLPQDPRDFSFEGVKINHPDAITRENYLALADLYRVKVEMPPADRVIVNKAFSNKGAVRKHEEVEIPKGYGCLKGKFNGSTWGSNLQMTIAASAVGYNYWPSDTVFKYINAGVGANQFKFTEYGNGLLLTDRLNIAFFGDDYALNFEIECKLTPEAYREWQIKAFQAIVEGYENLKAQANAEMSEFNPNLPGLNPFQKSQLIRNELQKEALRKMYRCRSLGILDKYIVGEEYQSDCCKDSTNAEKVRFLENVFDWRNMTYELYPYFYGSRDVLNSSGQKVSDNWDQIQKFTDDDPHFQSFLQASYATIKIPVHRDSEKEIAAVNFLINNSIGNYEIVPEGLLPIIEELDLEPATPFTYDLEGNELAEPVETIDLGIYNLPTSLVILECGTQDGVKPIGFPESTDAPSSDVIIPKQYSPAIIADSCNP